MSNGSCGVGYVNADVKGKENEIWVEQWWTSGSSGAAISLTGNETADLTNDEAIDLAALLIAAAAPANMVSNGYKRWAANVTETLTRILNEHTDVGNDGDYDLKISVQAEPRRWVVSVDHAKDMPQPCENCSEQVSVQWNGGIGSYLHDRTGKHDCDVVDAEIGSPKARALQAF